jgi:NAD dependent epimerase/dehydratase family enzyme
MPAILPIPKLALRVAFGEMAGAVLASQRAVPRVAERSGYVFQYADLDAALNNVVRGTS